MTTLTDVTLADLELFRHGAPWATFADLRREDPVHWNPEPEPNSGFWSVMRYDDIIDVLRNPEAFSSQLGAVSLEELDTRQLEIRRSMLETDGTRHRALRKLLQSDFTPRGLAGYEMFLRGITASTLDRALTNPSFDFVADVAADFPIRVLAQLLDVPESDIPQLIKWGNQMVGNTDPEATAALLYSPESEQFRDLPFRSPAALEVFKYGYELAWNRRGGTGTDLVSKVLNTPPADGLPLDARDFRNYFLLLVISGNETTRHTITHTMNYLMANPDQLALLRERPELIPWAVEEFLRVSSAVYHFRRTATRDIVLNGKEIKAGEKVTTWFGSGNRDEAVFEDPDRLDVTRKPNQHMTFGRGGPHLCLGNSLARMEIQIMFEDLLARDADLVPDGRPDYVYSNFVHGFKRLPVRQA